MTRQQLDQTVLAKKSLLCVGLDPDVAKLPKHLPKTVDGVVSFCKSIIDATADLCVAYKPNLAFFEALGPNGWSALEEVKSHIPEGIFTVADAKRGDIGTTSQKYAEALLSHMDFDSITVAPYMGSDSILPFLEIKDKWVILLGLTSNAGSADFQRLPLANGLKLWEQVINTTAKWGSEDNMMYVIGATHAEEFSQVRAIVPNHYLLVPGVGAQGGSMSSVVAEGRGSQSHALLVNASRSILYASAEEDFAEKARAEAIKLNLESLQSF